MALAPYTEYNRLSVAAPELNGLWDFAPIPGTVREDGTLDRSQSSNGTACIILKDTDYPEEAWEFIKFTALDPVGNALWARAAGATPMLRDAQLDWMHEFNALLPGLGLETFLQQVVEYPAIVNIRKVTTFNDINAVMVPAVNDVLNNITSAEVAMNQVAPIVQMLIDAGDQ